MNGFWLIGPDFNDDEEATNFFSRLLRDLQNTPFAIIATDEREKALRCTGIDRGVPSRQDIVFSNILWQSRP